MTEERIKFEGIDLSTVPTECVITHAVVTNNPKLITEHYNFDVKDLKNSNCVIARVNFDDNTSIECKRLNCEECPFSANNNNATIESAKKWLQIEE